MGLENQERTKQKRSLREGKVDLREGGSSGMMLYREDVM